MLMPLKQLHCALNMANSIRRIRVYQAIPFPLFISLQLSTKSLDSREVNYIQLEVRVRKFRERDTHELLHALDWMGHQMLLFNIIDYNLHLKITLQGGTQRAKFLSRCIFFSGFASHLISFTFFLSLNPFKSIIVNSIKS